MTKPKTKRGWGYPSRGSATKKHYFESSNSLCMQYTKGSDFIFGEVIPWNACNCCLDVIENLDG